uniref:Secreted protein n=1 Tax=Caenorhabditis japonica TaxID=281687 RepID=A0A8R1IK99_CAEJA
MQFTRLVFILLATVFFLVASSSEVVPSSSSVQQNGAALPSLPLPPPTQQGQNGTVLELPRGNESEPNGAPQEGGNKTGGVIDWIKSKVGK